MPCQHRLRAVAFADGNRTPAISIGGYRWARNFLCIIFDVEATRFIFSTDLTSPPHLVHHRRLVSYWDEVSNIVFSILRVRHTPANVFITVRVDDYIYAVTLRRGVGARRRPLLLPRGAPAESPRFGSASGYLHHIRLVPFNERQDIIDDSPDLEYLRSVTEALIIYFQFETITTLSISRTPGDCDVYDGPRELRIIRLEAREVPDVITID